MAQDVVNATNSDATGNQRIGNIIVNSGGRGVNGYKKNDDDEQLTPVTGLDTQYDARFDDPTYYG